jgi:hypothetical protein
MRDTGKVNPIVPVDPTPPIDPGKKGSKIIDMILLHDAVNVKY